MFLNDLWKVLTLIWCRHCDDCGLTWQNAMVLTRCHGEKRCSSGIHPPMWDFKMDRSTKKSKVTQGVGLFFKGQDRCYLSIRPSIHPSMQPSIHPFTASILRYLCRCWPQETSILSSATELVAWFLTSERGYSPACDRLEGDLSQLLILFPDIEHPNLSSQICAKKDLLNRFVFFLGGV